MTTVRLGTIDISRWVATVPRMAQQAADYGQLLVTDLPTIVGDNTAGFWSAANPFSPFHGAILSELPITIEREGLRVWEGFVQGIRSDGKARTAEMTMRSEIQRKLDGGCIYVSGTTANPAETPASIARAICDLYGIATESGTFGQSNDYYALDNVLLSCTLITPEITVREALSQLAQIGCARIFWDGAAMHFEVWRGEGRAPIETFSDQPGEVSRLFEAPSVEPLEKQETNGYSVQWLGGTADYGADPISISGGPDGPFQIISLQAAVWLGERWLDYMQTPQQRVTFSVSAAFGRSLRLGYPVAVEYLTGKWVNSIIVDIVSIDQSSPLVAQIVGVTR